MKKLQTAFVLFLVLMLNSLSTVAQCSICTKTAQQMGEKPAAALNNGILYLAAIPFMVIGYIGYRWWQQEKHRQ